MKKDIFHLGLCMAGSVSAGAYTAGVMDYLLEALRKWEMAKENDATVPQHQVIIDLLCGSSGGGITAAMMFFAAHDAFDHVELSPDGKTYKKPGNNIFWDSWVELSGEDVFAQMLSADDITEHYISSALNATFIDVIAGNFKDYIQKLAARKRGGIPAFFGTKAEMFVTLFNVTGINYELHSKASTSTANKQYISDHRDIAHFRWCDYGLDDIDYPGDGRMGVTLDRLEHIDVILDAAKATGAFPIGLKARPVSRPAKFIWDNPFFSKDGKFKKEHIYLGPGITKPEQLYTSLNGDGGVANNEPVEVARNILLRMRRNHYKDMATAPLSTMSETEQKIAAQGLTNTSVLLIDPFPSLVNRIVPPDPKSDHLFKYAPKLLGSMRSQLLFDAKEALDAYKKDNYGLHIIAPSREGFSSQQAIACGSLGGFGGFLEREFRVHDYFLGRHNCQSFLRKYFVVDCYETDPESLECVSSVIEGYKSNPEARKRFEFTDEKGKKWVPVIPDVTLTEPLTIKIVDGKPKYDEPGALPKYKLDILPENYLDNYIPGIRKRFAGLSLNLLKWSPFMRLMIRIGVLLTRKRVTRAVLNFISKDFRTRKLMK